MPLRVYKMFGRKVHRNMYKCFIFLFVQGNVLVIEYFLVASKLFSNSLLCNRETLLGCFH